MEVMQTCFLVPALVLSALSYIWCLLLRVVWSRFSIGGQISSSNRKIWSFSWAAIFLRLTDIRHHSSTRCREPDDFKASDVHRTVECVEKNAFCHGMSWNYGVESKKVLDFWGLEAGSEVWNVAGWGGETNFGFTTTSYPRNIQTTHGRVHIWCVFLLVNLLKRHPFSVSPPDLGRLWSLWFPWGFPLRGTPFNSLGNRGYVFATWETQVFGP